MNKMAKYIIDAYAWIEYLDGSTEGEKVKEILEESKNEAYTCAVTAAEVASKVKRSNMNVEVALNAIKMLSQIVDVDFIMAKNAGETHAKMRKKIKDFGLGDCFVLECRNKIGGEIITGDPHFRDMDSVVFIK